jgi:mxaK protein
MRRHSVHGLFAALALVCGGVALVQGLRLQRTHALNEQVAAVAAAPVASDAGPAARDAPREVRLAHAVALARAGAFESAFKTYSGLIGPGPLDAVGRQALFNLGNMYLRQGTGTAHASPQAGQAATTGARAAGEASPLVELAKQRYRDLLRADPHDWDARYNLERALRFAPEDQPAFAEDENVPVERRRVMLRGMEPGDLP